MYGTLAEDLDLDLDLIATWHTVAHVHIWHELFTLAVHSGWASAISSSEETIPPQEPITACALFVLQQDTVRSAPSPRQQSHAKS